jgi:hypothetical protein
MTPLTSLQGNGGGRIPMEGFSYDVSRQELTRIIEAMPTERCRAMHIAARQGDTHTAQRLLREAAENWYGQFANAPYHASAPAAPAASVAPRHRARRATPIRSRS